MDSFRTLAEMSRTEFMPWDIVKSKIRLSITMLEKIEDENGNVSLKVTGSKIINMSGKEFKTNLEEDRLAGVKHKVEIVHEKPNKFQINGIYILADGKKAWVYTEKSN